MLRALISRVWLYVAGAAGVFIGLLYARQTGKSAGRREAEAKQAKATLKGVKDAREARSEIDALDDAAVRDRARQRMRESTKR